MKTVIKDFIRLLTTTYMLGSSWMHVYQEAIFSLHTVTRLWNLLVQGKSKMMDKEKLKEQMPHQAQRL